MFWQLALATCWRLTSVTKNACFVFRREFLKLFQYFSSNFCDCSLSSPFLSQLNLTQTLYVTHLNLHFCIIFFSNLQEKGMGFLCLTWCYSCFENNFLLLGCLCGLRYTMRTCFYLDCWVSVCLVSSLCDFQWLYTDILDIVTTLGH